MNATPLTQEEIQDIFALQSKPIQSDDPTLSGGHRRLLSRLNLDWRPSVLIQTNQQLPWDTDARQQFWEIIHQSKKPTPFYSSQLHWKKSNTQLNVFLSAPPASSFVTQHHTVWYRRMHPVLYRPRALLRLLAKQDIMELDETVITWPSILRMVLKSGLPHKGSLQWIRSRSPCTLLNSIFERLPETTKKEVK